MKNPKPTCENCGFDLKKHKDKKGYYCPNPACILAEKIVKK